MKAVEITKPGEPEVLAAAERPRPEPRADEILVRVAAAGVNRPDVLQRRGHYPVPPGASDIPGLEIAGEVVACGSAVKLWKKGDKVCALVAGGGYAEYCLAPAPQCLPVPRGLDLVAAAALPETFFTVWTNVFERGRLAAGESILVHGGSSGIGTTAIQLARARGARVFATAGSAEKCGACERLGAERAINYRETDFLTAIRDLTAGRGVDVILDMVGGEYFARNLESLAVEGRLVEIATLGGARAELNIPTIMQRRLTVTGSTLRPRPVADKGEIARAVHTHVWPLVEAGSVKPVVFRTFPLARAAAESTGDVGYVRGNAVALPFRADTFDARCRTRDAGARVLPPDDNRRFRAQLADLDERDVTWLDSGLDEQLLADWYDLHDLFASIDEAADGRDFHVVDDAVDRRPQFTAA